MTDGPFGSHLTSAHYTQDGPLVVRLQNIGDGFYRHAAAHISEAHFGSLRKHEVFPGDLLVASLGESLPRACLAPPDLGPAIVKADCIRIRLSDDVDPRWVMYALQRPDARRWAKDRLHGVGRPRLGLKLIREIPVPLPAMAEQRQTVAILDDHLSRLDAADDYLEVAKNHSEQLYESAIHHAIGHAGYPLVPLSRVLSTPLSNGRSVLTRPGGFPVLRLTALRGERVDLTARKPGAWNKTDAERFLVAQGDVFVSRGNGSKHLVGRAAMVHAEPDPVAFPDTMIRLRPNREVIDPAFLVSVWNSPAVRRQIEAVTRTTAGIYKVSQRDLAGIALPLPSLTQQLALQRQWLPLRQESESAARSIDAAKLRSGRLRQTILSAAFSGRLTGRSSDLDLVAETAFA